MVSDQAINTFTLLTKILKREHWRLACNAILMRIGLIDILINDPPVRAFLDYPKVKDLMNIRLT
jgi:hypothetical protein